MENEEKIQHKLKEEIEKQIEGVLEQGIHEDNLPTLYRLVDIHKDIANEEYWKEKKEAMQMRYRYGNDYGADYGRENYGRRGRERDSRGRYKESGRGRNYRGEEMIDEMYSNYQEYSDGKEEMRMGNYGAQHDTMKSLEYMLESVVDFVEMLKKDANSQEEIQLIKEYTRKISEM